jgi:monovalent cation/hydrogen antiporter
VAACAHLDELIGADEPAPLTPQGCGECLKSGDSWVHLRMCLTCGHVGCCDSSANRHASRHSAADSHPVVRSFEPDEAWRWCYLHAALG